MIRKLFVLAMGLVTGFGLAIGSAYADADLFRQPINSSFGNWQSQRVHYVAIDQSVPNFLDEMGKNLNVRVDVSRQIRGRLQDRRFNAAASQVLDSLSDEYNFQWYFDGAVLYITSETEAVTRLIPLGGLSAYRIREELSGLGLYDKRFTFRFSPTSRMIMVAGPPRYVATIEAALTTLSDSGNRQPFTIIRGGRIDQERVIPLQQ